MLRTDGVGVSDMHLYSVWSDTQSDRRGREDHEEKSIRTEPEEECAAGGVLSTKE